MAGYSFFRCFRGIALTSEVLFLGDAAPVVDAVMA
jgi:hypothetical protein